MADKWKAECFMILCCIFSLSLPMSYAAEQWPVPYKRFDVRPKASSYCQAGVLPFCPSGRDANTMPKFKDTDQVEIYALKKPVWQFKFGDLLGKFNIWHDAIGILNLNTGKNYTMEWYELFQLFNCTFPHILQNNSLEWCNQGATCIYDGIDDNLWKKYGVLAAVANITGAQFNEFAEWVLWDNKTGIYYETWTVRSKPEGPMWFDSFDCASWVLRAFQEMYKIGAKFDTSVRLNYTRINLFSDMPIYLGDVAEVTANKTLSAKMLKFYSKFQNYKNFVTDIEHILEGIVEVLSDNEFYLFYNFKYWLLPMKSPFIKLTYNPIPLPGTDQDTLYFEPNH